MATKRGGVVLVSVTQALEDSPSQGHGTGARYKLQAPSAPQAVHVTQYSGRGRPKSALGPLTASVC